MRLRALAPAKVNLSLFVGGRREDGRHRVVTLMQTLSLADEVVAEVLDDGLPDGVVCPGVERENLAGRALAALRARGWDGPPLRITIAKRIPVAAGMAGGSADAAAVLRLAMALAPGRPEELDAIAASLGSDVPGQLLAGLVLGTGAGELVERFEGPAEQAFVVVPSGERLSTAEVYREADRLGIARGDDELRERYEQLAAAATARRPPPAELIVNDLEPAALSLCPAIAASLADVRAQEPAQAIVSGSGPTVVGIWWGAGAAVAAAEAARELAPSHPGTVSASPVGPELGLPGLL